MTVKKVMMMCDVNVLGIAEDDIDDEALASALQDFIDTVEFPPMYEQTKYDEDGMETDDTVEVTIDVDTINVSVE